MKNLLSLFLGLVGAITVFSISCSSPTTEEVGLVLDIPNLVHKTPTEVVEILGEPDTSYYVRILTKTFLVHGYKDHDIKIQYLKGKSDDIVVNDPQVEFKEESLRHFGIEPAPPTVFREKAMLKWKNYSGLKTINFYNVTTDSLGNIRSYKIYFKA